MSLSLDQIVKQLQAYRAPIVSENGAMSADFQRFLYGVINGSADIEETANTAQTTAEAAAQTSSYAEAVPTGYAWNSDPAGVFPAGNPTFDITVTFYNQGGTQVAQRILRGSLITSTGLISITAVSDSATADYSTAYTLTSDGTSSALAVVTLTLPDGNQTSHSVAWNAIDLSVAGGTPATGGGK